MKLEAGKFYRARNGDKVECIAVWIREVNGAQATCVGPTGTADDYCLDGRVFRHSSTSFDLVEEWKEPKKFEAWVNLDSDGNVRVFFSKQEADGQELRHMDQKIECRKIEWEVPE